MIGLIVEGTNDERRIKEVTDEFHIVILNGTRFSNREKDLIENAMEICTSVYILSDPDSAGDWIADKLMSRYPQLSRIEVDPDKACCLKWKGYKFGIEYMSNRDLRKILPFNKDHLK
jgi:ribonuclease M5